MQAQRPPVGFQERCWRSGTAISGAKADWPLAAPAIITRNGKNWVDSRPAVFCVRCRHRERQELGG